MKISKPPLWEYHRALERLDKEIAELQAKRRRLVANLEKRMAELEKEGTK